MYRLTIIDKARKSRSHFEYTSLDMDALELFLNTMRAAYDLPEFVELMDGTFTARNSVYAMTLEEITVTTKQTENGNTCF